jgi:hypothetical protein
LSFGTNNTTKTAENNLGGVSNAALNTQFPQVTAAGTNLLNLGGQGVNTGGQNVTAGTNFLNTVLGGNAANTAALLQPNIDQIRGSASNNLTAINTLTPRGGGRSSALFGQSFAPQQQINNLFNPMRTQAATALPQIGLQQQGVGLQQQGLGTNLFGLGNQALSAATGANTSSGQMGLQQQQINNQLMSGLGAGLFGLLTTPFGGGGARNGLLGLI